jgi:hypothetical protein
VYDVRAKKYHGQNDTLATTLAPGETALYASLPYRVTGLEVQGPQRATAGSQVELRCAVSADSQPLGDHVFHVELRDPASRIVSHYSQNVLAPAGRTTLRTPLALNESSGAWSAQVCDVLTGTTTDKPIQVIGP